MCNLCGCQVVSGIEFRPTSHEWIAELRNIVTNAEPSAKPIIPETKNVLSIGVVASPLIGSDDLCHYSVVTRNHGNDLVGWD